MFSDFQFHAKFEFIRKAILSNISLKSSIKDELEFEKLTHSESRFEVIHVGGHLGQEAQEYDQYGLRVLWIEAIPEIHKLLRQSTSIYKKQKTICCVVGRENRQVVFNISNNNFLSSSIYKFSGEYEKKQQLKMDKEMKLSMRTLDSILEGLKCIQAPYWVLDVQGAELDVLIGAEKSLEMCHILEVEVSVFRTYLNAPLFAELNDFLLLKGFRCITSPPPEFHGNVLYVRVKR
jgi:FkbM family methyltransferase